MVSSRLSFKVAPITHVIADSIAYGHFDRQETSPGNPLPARDVAPPKLV